MAGITSVPILHTEQLALQFRGFRRGFGRFQTNFGCTIGHVKCRGSRRTLESTHARKLSFVSCMPTGGPPYRQGCGRFDKTHCADVRECGGVGSLDALWTCASKPFTDEPGGCLFPGTHVFRTAFSLFRRCDQSDVMDVLVMSLRSRERKLCFFGNNFRAKRLALAVIGCVVIWKSLNLLRAVFRSPWWVT